jgi:DNA polymerase-3 subunit beta
MKLTAPREEILAPLQSVIGVVERRQTMPVLSNVLVSARNNRLSLTGTDLEVELVCTRELQVQQAGEITVPGRKFLDILKALPDRVDVTITTEGDRLVIKAGRSRFTLATLPAAEFPLVDEINAQQTLKLPQAEFRRLIDKTHFSMAQQDVRYYLNGMLLEAEGKQLRAVATDGHRLALCEIFAGDGVEDQAAGDRSAQGRTRAAAHHGRRRRHRAGDRHESRSRPDRRNSLHIEAD